MAGMLFLHFPQTIASPIIKDIFAFMSSVINYNTEKKMNEMVFAHIKKPWEKTTMFKRKNNRNTDVSQRLLENCTYEI
jgi:hypothetical protein